MSILLSVNNYYYHRGGAEVVFFAQNRLLESAGWEVIPFAMKHDMNLATPWSKHFVEEIEFGQSYSVLEKIRRIPKAVYSLESRKKLARLLALKRPDICHAHNIYHHLSPSFLPVLKHHGVPTVLTLHDLKLACPAYTMLTHDGVCERCKGGGLFNVVTHRCLKQSLALSVLVYLESTLNRLLGSYADNVDRFVVPSRFYLKKFVEWGWPEERFAYIPNFVEVETLSPRYSAGEFFLYLGRLSPEKGLVTLVKAAARTGLPVHIAGTGPEESRLRELAVETGAKVEFLGYRTGDSLHELIRSARAVVLPSEWYENAPMSVLESYALGTPVIGARIGGIPELVRENETGRLFRSADVDDLARTLRDFAVMSDADISEMGRVGRRWVETNFTTAHYLQRILDLYSILGVSSKSSAAVS